MSMLMYMPWCRIDHDHKVGEVAILPFAPAVQPADVESAAWSRVCTVLGTHKDINGNPVDRAALVRFEGKSLTDDLTDEEIEVAGDLVAIACFASLVSREYFLPFGQYCNSDCFTLHIQKFTKSDVTAISTRRRDGRSLSAWAFDKVAISVPVHCHAIKEISLANVLLDALLSQRASASDREWGRWQNSITCFNLANTDSGNFREHIEWVLLCSAFEHLLDAKSKAQDVARLFHEALVPARPFQVTGAGRLAARQTGTGDSVRYVWMREFYRVRGDFAHGRLVSQQRMRWKPHEHLMLATIAFPLVLKSFLVKGSRYVLTKDDRAQIDCFEALADMPTFFSPPSGPKSGWDSEWARLVEERKREMASEEFLSACMNAPAARKHSESQEDKDDT